MRRTALVVAVLALAGHVLWAPGGQEDIIWLEAEQFAETGTWSNDPQHVDIMGSPYLLATGLGKPVADAVTTVKDVRSGAYRLWVRCRDWLPSHSPGRFQVLVGGKPSEIPFGKAEDDAWRWVDGGTFELEAGDLEVRIHDTTGWWGRCDAVVLARRDFKPSDDLETLARQRETHGGVGREVRRMKGYDVVVVGGGPAGCGAAVAAARHGAKVAFIQDRPVLGGNASSEIQVPPMGYIGKPPDRVNVSGLAEEFFPKQGWRNFADSKKLETIVRSESNIDLHLNTRATAVTMAGSERIESVLAMDVRTGQRYAFHAPRFIDCTGHGWIGFYAGAEYRMGQEARDEFGESLAPVKAGKRTMGNSLYKAVFKTHPPGGGAAVEKGDGIPFECPPWAHIWKSPDEFEPPGSHRRIKDIRRPENFDRPSRGKGRNPGNDINGAITYAWWVEYGGMLDTIRDAEKIRDELLRISLGLWNYAKNHNPKTVEKNRYRELVWLNYVPGVRESRRLVGDYIMTQRDYDERIVHPDTIGFTDWGPDVHHPEGFWVRGNDCIHVYQGRRTSIPYRTLYSKNIGNLFMAGRCHSATHIAFGGTRVMRPLCMTGQAAGTAAAVAARRDCSPRDITREHIRELQQALLRDGCYLMGVKNEDPRDLALRAKVTASSASEEMGPEKAVNGWNRILGKDRNAWTPASEAKGPHWLQLDLARQASITEVHVTFEATAVPCRIEAGRGDAWKPVATLAADSPRRSRLRLEKIDADRIRLVAEGVAPVVCEIRVYK